MKIGKPREERAIEVFLRHDYYGKSIDTLIELLGLHYPLYSSYFLGLGVSQEKAYNVVSQRTNKVFDWM